MAAKTLTGKGEWRGPEDLVRLQREPIVAILELARQLNSGIIVLKVGDNAVGLTMRDMRFRQTWTGTLALDGEHVHGRIKSSPDGYVAEVTGTLVERSQSEDWLFSVDWLEKDTLYTFSAELVAA